MNKYKLTALISDSITIINIDNNIPHKIPLSEGKLYDLRKMIRHDPIVSTIIKFESKFSIEEIIEILKSDDITITKMFIDVIKSNRV